MLHQWRPTSRAAHRSTVITDLFAPPAGQLLTHSGLLSAGYSPHEIRRAVVTGALTALTRGSYTAGQAYRASSAEAQHLLRARSRGLGSPSVVLSHVSAAVVHGIPVPPDALAAVHVTRSGRGGSRRGSGVWQHAAVLAAGDVTVVDEVAVTAPSRTLVDLSRWMSFENAVIAEDVALRVYPGLVTELPDVLLKARHLPGAGAARRALEFSDGRAESPGESRTRVLLHREGLPTPELQCEIFDDRGSFVGRVDLAIPDCGVVVEFDGMVKYGDLLRGKLTAGQVLAREKRREDQIRELGWMVVRLTWSDLADPVRTGSRLRSAMTRGRRLKDVSGLVGTHRCTPPIRIGTPDVRGSAASFEATARSVRVVAPANSPEQR